MRWTGLAQSRPALPAFILAATAAYGGSVERPDWDIQLAIASQAETSSFVTVTFHDLDGTAVAGASYVVLPGATKIVSLDDDVSWPDNRAGRPIPFLGSARIQGGLAMTATVVGVYDNAAARQAWCATRAAPASRDPAACIPVPGGHRWPGVPTVPVCNETGDIVQPRFAAYRCGAGANDPLRLFQTLQPAGSSALAFSGWSLSASNAHAGDIDAATVRGAGCVLTLERLHPDLERPSRCACNRPDLDVEPKIVLLGPADDPSPRWVFVANDPYDDAPWHVEWLDDAGTTISETTVARDGDCGAAAEAPPSSVAARIGCDVPDPPPFAVVGAGKPADEPAADAWALEALAEGSGARNMLAPLLLAGDDWTSHLQVFNPGAENVDVTVRLGTSPPETRAIPPKGSAIWTVTDATVPAVVECDEPVLAAVFSQADDGRRCAYAARPATDATLVAPMVMANYSPHRRTMLGGADRGNTRIAAKQHYLENEMDRLCLSPEASGYGWSHPSGLGNPARAWERGHAAVRCVMIYRVNHTETKATAAADFARRQPGCIWLMGNEPNLTGQSNQTPEEFTQGYHDLREAILDADPTARFAPFALAHDTSPETLYRPDPVPDPPPDQKTLFRMYLERSFEFWSTNYGGLLPMDYFAIHRYPTGDPNNMHGDIIPKWGDGTKSDGRPSIREMRTMIDDLGYPDVAMLLTEYGVFWGDTGGWSDARRLAFMWHSQNWLEQHQDELNIAAWFWFIGVRDKDVPWAFGPLIIQDFEEYQGIPGPWVTYLGELYRDLAHGTGPVDESGATRYLRARPFEPETCPPPTLEPADPSPGPWFPAAYLADLSARADSFDAAGNAVANSAFSTLYGCFLSPVETGTTLVLTRDDSGRNRFVDPVSQSGFPRDIDLAHPATPPCAWSGSGVLYGAAPFAGASITRYLRVGDRDGLGRAACEAADRPAAALVFPYLTRNASATQVFLVNTTAQPITITCAWAEDGDGTITTRSETLAGRGLRRIVLSDASDPLVPAAVSDPSGSWQGCLRVRADVAGLVGSVVMAAAEGPASYAAIPEDRCGTTAWAAGVRRLVSGSTWTAATRFAIAAVGEDGHAAADVDWLAPEGTALLSYPVTIPAGSCLVFDTQDGGTGVPAEFFTQLPSTLGGNYIGTVRVRAANGVALAAANLLRFPQEPAIAANAPSSAIAGNATRWLIACVKRSSFPPNRSWVELLNTGASPATVDLSFHAYSADPAAEPCLRLPVEIAAHGLVVFDTLDGGAGIDPAALDALGDPFLGFVRGESFVGSVIAQSWTLETLPDAAFGLAATVEAPQATDALGIR